MSQKQKYADYRDALLQELARNGDNAEAAAIKLGIVNRTARKWRDKLAAEITGDSQFGSRKSAPEKPKAKKKSPPASKHDNSRILLISDMHIPYHHKNTIPFLKMLKERYKPTRVICLGDELDKHALSFHAHDPDLASAGHELAAALPVIKELYEIFPEMDLLESNHGSLVWRKAKEHGIPRHYIRSYNDVLGVGPGWKWHDEMVLDLPDGQKVYLHHGKSADAAKTSQAMSMSHACGHYHNSFGVKYWANPTGLFWAMNCGCLIDDTSLAFAYNSVNLHRPIIGTALIIDGVPILEAMDL